MAVSMTGQNAVFSASYTDLKLVKTRSVGQVVLELPIERIEAFVALFGIPQPGKEQAVAIALLDLTKASPEPETEARTDDPAPAPKAPTTEAQRAIALAGILPNELAFRRWINGFKPENRMAEDCGVEKATELLRARIGVVSRREIAHGDQAFRAFEQMNREYRHARGLV